MPYANIGKSRLPDGENASRPFSVAILAGGQSIRMGADKASLQLENGGPTLIEMVAASIADLSDDRFLVNRDGTKRPELDLPAVADSFGDSGVLGGIATALAAANYPDVVIVSCDMPFLDTALLRFVGNASSYAEVLIPVLDQPSRQTPGGTVTYQTLHARYSRDCLPAIERALNTNRRRVISFFADVAVEVLPESLCRKFRSRPAEFHQRQ